MIQLRKHIQISRIHITSLCLLLIICNQAIGKGSYEIVTKGDKKGLADNYGNIIIPVIYDNLGWSDGGKKVFDDVIGYSEDEHWGLISIDNNRITKPLFRNLFPAKEKLLIASVNDPDSKNELHGIIDMRGKVIIGFQYIDLVKYTDMMIVSRHFKGKKIWGALNFKGRTVIPIKYNKVKRTSQNFVAFLDKKASLFTLKGRQLIGFAYRNIEEINGYLITKDSDGRQGLIDQEGKEIIPTSYKEISLENDSVFLLKEFPMWQLISPEEGAIKTFFYDNVETVGARIYKVSANKKYGLMRGDGSKILPIEYDSIYCSKNHFYALTYSDNEESWQIYSTLGDLVVSNSFQAVYPMSENLIAVKKDDYWGYIDHKGNVAIDYKFDHCWPFLNGRAKVKYLDNEGIINNTGEWYFNPFGNSSITIMNEYLSVVKSGKKTSILNERGGVLHETYSRLEPLTVGVLEITHSGKLGLFNNRGKNLLNTFYDEIVEGTSKNVFIIKKNNKQGVIDQDGNWIISLTDEYDEIIGLSEDFLSIKKDGKYGFIDKNGNLRIANRYEGVKELKDGMVAIKLLGKWGFIDRTERLKIQPLYDSVSNFNKGRAFVIEEGLYGIIDMEGNEILAPNYDSLYKNSFHSFVIIEEKKFGLVTKQGILQLKPKYEFLEQNADGNLIIRKRGKYGVIDKQGINLIPTVYKEIIYDTFNQNYLASKDAKNRNFPVP